MSVELDEPTSELVELLRRLQSRAYDSMSESPDIDLQRLLRKVDGMMTALSEAAALFDMYGKGHRAKASGIATIVEGMEMEAKAVRNEKAASMCRTAIFAYPDLIPDVADESVSADV